MIAAIITMLASGALGVSLCLPKKVIVVPTPVATEKFTNHWYDWEGN